VWPPDSANTVSPHPPLSLTFHRLTLKLRVAFKVGNLPSKFGHARPSGSRIILCVRDGQTDRQTDGRMDKSNSYSPFSTVGGIIILLIDTVNEPWQNILVGEDEYCYLHDASAITRLLQMLIMLPCIGASAAVGLLFRGAQ